MIEISQLYEQAPRYLAGGVCASARANAAIGHPLYLARGEGSRIYDIVGREHIDMCMSHGASLLGHNHPRIKAAVAKALGPGIICSHETEHHVALARRVTELVPCAELVRFAGSGTEMSGTYLAHLTTVLGALAAIEQSPAPVSTTV
ncbi:MAG: aminotransferase class III-fold pyridoxal phosphate-dependent enzyme [Candidatus Anammoximicrobium sp.]|nr:aminotransferase class III-fold pyridoxal phosphate-dependent enzyme [Candidatus Anammoximicrobium sp.]